MEKMAVFYQYVVSLGAHLPDPAEHDPCTPVTQSGFAPWEEMGAHVLQSHGSEGCRNLFITRILLW